MKNTETEQVRQKFFKECDLIVMVPATYYLKGSSFSNEASVFLFNSYIYVGIIKGKTQNVPGWPRKGKYSNLKLNFFEPPSEEISETAFVDAYSRLEDIAERRINISTASRELLKNSTFKLWCPFAYDHPLLNLQEDISTAFGLLAYCVENGIQTQEELKKETWEWQESLGIGDDGKVANISLIHRNKSMPSLRKITEIFKFCWLLQDTTNGSACFASLVGVSGLSDLINFKISLDEMENIEPLIKERHPIKFFDMIENSLTKGSIQVGLYANECAICSMLLGYTEEKKEKFWGSILTPYFFDDCEKISLSIFPKSTARGTEKWPWKFEYNKGYFAFFAPKNIMKNIKDEIRFMQNTWIHYDSDIFEKWGHLSAKIEQGNK